MSALAGKRILVVEDEFFIAEMAVSMLEELGAAPLGPCATVSQALAALEQDRPDAALLDINLNGERSFPIAEALSARGVPFLVVTGYGASGSADMKAPVLDKPYNLTDLDRMLTLALNGRG